ncbi:hypothetical protein [Sphingomonas sp.]|uniref:hypothetical protein n=1 Tax=Sphingomonas sp. TaxID=28214 RepID=UPI002DD62602|nr:hypothetical protein [Sphingomonas sp.]
MDNESVWPEMAAKPEFGWLAEAKRYLLAGEVLRQSDEYESGKLLVTPTLHVAAHGIELFLKAALIRNGATEIEARKFGHDILALWNDGRNLNTRADILTAAAEEWEAAKQNPHWKDDFGAFEKAPLEEYVQRLSELHTRETDYALRYTAGRTSTTAGPKPHLLSATFYRICDRYLREMTHTSRSRGFATTPLTPPVASAIPAHAGGPAAVRSGSTSRSGTARRPSGR